MSQPLRLELPLGQLGRLTGQTETLTGGPDRAGLAGGSLDRDQAAVAIGDPVPLVFCRWRPGEGGGVAISPLATDAAFTNNAEGAVTARYQLLLSDGQLAAGIQVRDTFQGGYRVGALTTAYDRRAGDWGPGYSLTSWLGNPAPVGPAFVGSGQGRFNGLTMGSFTVTRPAEDPSWRGEVQAFVREGVSVDRLIDGTPGASDNLADLVIWALLRTGRVSPQLIDKSAMLEAAQFLEANGLRFNGVIQESSGILDWFSRVLPHYCLRLVRRQGVYRLRPLLPTLPGGALNLGQIDWAITLTNDDVDVPSVRVSSIPAADRQPLALQMQWRQQPESPETITRTTEVRYGGSALAGPYQQRDLSGYATTQGHVLLAGAYELATRRYVSHRVVMRIRPSADSETLQEGDRLRLVLTVYNPDVGLARIDQLYTVEQISRTPSGVATIEAVNLPVDSQGRSLVALDVAAAVAGAVDVPLPLGRSDQAGDGGEALDAPEDSGPCSGWQPGTYPDFYAGAACRLGGLRLDLNDFLDATILPDLGPWSGWDPPGLNEALYPPTLALPEGVDQLPLPPVSDLGVVSPLNPFPAIPTAGASSPLPLIGDGWGPGRVPALDIGELNLPGEDPFAGYQGGITFEDVILSYPEVWYLIDQPGAVGLTGRVVIDSPPIDGDLRLILTDGLETDIEVTIAEGETSADLPPGLTTRTDTLFEDAERTLTVLSWSGGGYEQADPTELEPDPGPAVSVTPSDVTVRTYVATTSVEAARPWFWDGVAWAFADIDFDGRFLWSYDLQRWVRLGIPVTPGTPFTDDLPWEWDEAQQLWTFQGLEAGWTWLVPRQRWQRNFPTTLESSRPDGPPSQPPPVPVTQPPAPDYFTIVAEVVTDRVPVNSLLESLSIAIEDYRDLREEFPPGTGNLIGEVEDVQLVGDALVNGVPMFFGDWRWNPAEQWWSRESPDPFWQWDPAAITWVYLGDPGDWRWNQPAEEWQDGTGAPPSPPPLQDGSAQPPDGERWTLSLDGTLWEGTFYKEGGVAPYFEHLLRGSATYHLPYDSILAPPGLPSAM